MKTKFNDIFLFHKVKLILHSITIKNGYLIEKGVIFKQKEEETFNENQINHSIHFYESLRTRAMTKQLLKKRIIDLETTVKFLSSCYT